MAKPSILLGFHYFWIMVVLIVLAEFIFLTPLDGRTSACCPWQSCSTQAVLQLCQEHHVIILWFRAAVITWKCLHDGNFGKLLEGNWKNYFRPHRLLCMANTCIWPLKHSSIILQLQASWLSPLQRNSVTFLVFTFLKSSFLKDLPCKHNRSTPCKVRLRPGAGWWRAVRTV